ncbi:C4-dicarboxylate transport protein [Streptomyces antimycoticus]
MAAGVAKGKRIVNSAPPSGAADTSTVPALRRAAWRTRARPRPRPWAFVLQPRRKTSSAAAGSSPAPVSATRSVSSPPSARAVTVTRALRGTAVADAVGGLALGYFMVMSTVALAIGLVVGNFLEPGSGLHMSHEAAQAGQSQAEGASESTADFLLGIIPKTLVSAFTEGEVLQTLFVALLAGFALQAMGKAGEPVLRGIGHIQQLVFKLLSMVMWAAPVGAFGAMAAVVGETGLDALKALAVIMIGFYVTCALFVFLVLGTILRLVAGVNIFLLLKYLAREFLLILSTSSSESALPLLIAKMEHAGVSKPVAGITVPTGYSFNLDGTAIYLTMASLFIAEAMGDPLSIGQQIPSSSS